MELAIFQKGFNFSQDGPGNRLVYHLQGCNLRCPWCSNPEGLACMGGTRRSVEELAAEILRSRPMFFDGGGVTFTGGEATMQMDALYTLLSILHREGVHTAIETNGTLPRLPELFPVLDLLIMDCKHHSSQRMYAAVGEGNEIIAQNLRAAVEAGQRLLLRIPLIGGFNASESDAEAFAIFFLAQNAHGESVELLPYHEYGRDKWTRLGLPYAMTDSAFVSAGLVTAMEGVFCARGFAIQHT